MATGSSLRGRSCRHLLPRVGLRYFAGIDGSFLVLHHLSTRVNPFESTFGDRLVMFPILVFPSLRAVSDPNLGAEEVD